MKLDVHKIREDFPILKLKNPHGNPLIYLDNAATTQKPWQVIKCIEDYYTGYNANIHRGGYWPATQATSSYENARKKVAEFIHADSEKSIIFTAGTTDSINKLLNAYLDPMLNENDEVVISEMEHHSNLIPWQQICIRKGAKLRWIPINSHGELELEIYYGLLSEKTKIVSVSAVSNTLGNITDLEKIINAAHQKNIPVLVDAAQSVPHYQTDVHLMDCDFLAFSAHKVYGPTGLGILYIKEDHLDKISPAQYGGGTIKNVSFEETIFAEAPAKFEAGTPNISGAIALASALDYVENIGWDYITNHNLELANYALESLSAINSLQILGDFKPRAPVLSFNLEGIHPHDVAGLLAEDGIAIRAGHHCTQPLMDIFKIHGTCRVSFAMYNTKDEVDKLKSSLKEVIKFFR